VEVSGHAGKTDRYGGVRLLQGVRNSGSLFKAARQVGLSYRHAWALMGKWAQLLGQPLLVLERGRGASLTPLATRLLAAERRANAQLAPQIGSLIADITPDIAAAARPSPARLRMHASHDLALAGLRDALNAAGELQLDIQFQGSVDSLAALARGACDLAGFHFATGDNTGEARAAFRHWLKPRSQKLIHFASREQGLMVAAGNPLAIHGLADLTRKKVRLINRQRGSGTRMEFDQLLKAEGIAADSLTGYQTEEFTHLAVAATVAGGLAERASASAPRPRNSGCISSRWSTSSIFSPARTRRSLARLCSNCCPC
jgi:molybdate transport repressor ModE-like protein